MCNIKHPSPSINTTNNWTSEIPMKGNLGLVIGLIFGKVFRSYTLIPLLWLNFK